MTNTPSYGNCFTFNSAINEKDTYGGERKSSMAGPNFGLDLVVNIEQSKYMAKVTESAGARVVVQSASAHPQPDEVGNQLIPNTNTALAMHEVPDLNFTMIQHTMLKLNFFFKHSGLSPAIQIPIHQTALVIGVCQT